MTHAFLLADNTKPTNIIMKRILILVMLLAPVLCQGDDRALWELQGQVTSCEGAIADDAPWKEKAVTFDAEGRVLTIGGLDANEPANFQIERDGDGRIVSMASDRGDEYITIKYTYDARGRVAKEETLLENDYSDGPMPWSTATLEYDDRGLLIKRTVTMADGSEGYTDTYTYSEVDEQGNWLTRRHLREGAESIDMEESRNPQLGTAEDNGQTDESGQESVGQTQAEDGQPAVGSQPEKKRSLGESLLAGLVLILEVLICIAIGAHMIYENFFRKPLQLHTVEEFRAMRQAAGLTDEPTTEEEDQMLSRSQRIDDLVTKATSGTGETFYTFTKGNQVKKVRQLMQEIEALAPTDPEFVGSYNQYAEVLNNAEKREFDGSWPFLALAGIILLIMAWGSENFMPILLFAFVGGTYYLASMRPLFMRWSDELKGKDTNKRKFMTGLMAGALGMVASAKTYKTVTHWSDGTTTTDTDDSETWISMALALIVILVAASLIMLVALVNYVRNYILYI